MPTRAPHPPASAAPHLPASAALRVPCVYATVALALLLCLLPALQAHAQAQAQTRAWLDRTEVTLGDTVTLNVESDQIGAEPDFSVLQQDFELLGTSSSTQVNLGSGGRRVSALRAVALQPRRSGTLSIPPLQVGSERTEALTLTVRDAPVATTPAQADQDVFVQIEVEPRDPYVQQQVRYTLRLFYAVTLLEGQLEEPAAEHVQVRRLGQDRSDQRVIDGRRYNMVERHYALIPERSGTLTIAPALFRGRAILPGQRSTWMGAGAVVSARGEAIELKVRAQPDAAPDPWLPAAEVVLEDASGSLPDSVRIGQPLTLTLRARARGLAAAQLPELELPPIDGAEVYPDQPVARDGNEGAWLLGERERKFALVPDRVGALHLPAVELHWWNTSTGRMEVARIAERSVQVLPAEGAATQAAAPAGTSTAIAPGNELGPERTGGFADAWVPGRWPPGAWQLLTAVFALLWLLTLGWGWSLRRARPEPVHAARHAEGAQPSQSRAAQQLRAALQSGDLARIAVALRALAQARGIPARSLGELAARVDDPAQRKALRALEAARFGAGDGDAALALLRAAFNGQPLHATGPAAQAPATDAEPLPPLYPR